MASAGFYAVRIALTAIVILGLWTAFGYWAGTSEGVRPVPPTASLPRPLELMTLIDVPGGGKLSTVRVGANPMSFICVVYQPPTGAGTVFCDPNSEPLEQP